MRLFPALLSVVVLSVFISSCAVQKTGKPSPEIGLRLSLDTSSVLRNSLSGLVLYDPATSANVFAKNAGIYFAPASNTKIFSLFACLNTLSDSIPALRYIVKGDSLIFWGTADPTFLHPDFAPSKTLDFFKAYPDKKLFFSTSNFNNPHYGAGWAWDDYNDDYQPEITSLPVYGNIVRVGIKAGNIKINPAVFQSSFIDSENAQQGYIKRHMDDNHFTISKKVKEAKNYKQDIPFKTSDGLTAGLLSDTLNRVVELSRYTMPHDAKTIYSFATDTVYRRMMVVSDNMLAEQLLLLAGNTYSDTISSSSSIEAIRSRFLDDLPDPAKWVDGSGLSRYNLFTPQSLVKLLDKMYAKTPHKRLFSLFPAGGQSGTIKTAYKSGDPFIFAKSGSMSGVYNLSGYLKTKSGKTLIFSFMNNNFTHPVSKVRNEVSKILTWVHENY